MAGRSVSETSIANEEQALAKPLHLQRLEHAVRLESFLEYVNQQFQTNISSSAEESTENDYRSEVDGEFSDVYRANGILSSSQERRSDRMKLYNFTKVKKNRKCLKNILLSDSSDSEDDDSDDAVYHMLKIHKLRSSASVEFAADSQLHRYQYYSTGLLSVNDKFYEHQKSILSNKKRLKKANKKKSKVKKRKMEMDDELSLSQQEEAIIREAMKLEESTVGVGDDNSLEPVTPSTKSRKKNPAAHEAMMNMKRRRLWVAIGKKEINRAQKQLNAAHKEVLSNARRLAVACQRECRRSALLSQKVMKEIPSRARRLTKEMLLYWKRYDKVEKEHRKKAEKEAQEQLRIDIELREAKRQQRKLNFLITQTELYAHFMSKKIAGLKDEKQSLILDQLNEEKGDNQRVNCILDDDYDIGATKAKALKNAENAFNVQQMKTKSFDTELIDVLKNNDNFDESFHLTEPSLSTEEDFPQPQMFQGKLKTYQLKGMNWLYNLYDKGINGILADEMGLGKTIQTIAFLATLAELQGIWGPYIIIAPASTLHNWQQEITKFVPKFKVLPYWGNTSDRKILRKFWSQKDLHTEKSSFHVLITSYQLVVQDVKYFSRIKWQYMVLDEAQAIKSTSSVRWKILLGFSCRNRLLLTGTPIQNSMAELWALLHFIMPTLFDSHNEFNEWFSKDIESHAENKSAIDEKHLSRLHMILKPFMLRRIKKDVENELSDKIEILMYCQLTRRQKVLYKGLRNKISIDDLMQSSSSTSSQAQSATSSLMNLVMQFRKVCNHPDLFERREPKSPFFLKMEPIRLPRLVFQEKTSYSSYCAFSFTRLIDISPAELSLAALSGFLSRWLLSYLMFQGAYRIQHQHVWKSLQSKHFRSLLLSPAWLSSIAKLVASSALQELLFANQLDNPVLTFSTHTIHRMIETPQHFKMRQLKAPQKDLIFEPRTKQSGSTHLKTTACMATGIPRMLLQTIPQTKSHPVQVYSCDPAVRWFQLRQNFKDSKEKKDFIEQLVKPSFFSYQPPVGITACRPLAGWSQILIADKESLVTDSGKLQVLDILLRKLKKEQHRVLIYSQMTRMIDLLEEYMWHRKHTYMRLDGSSKISDRRDMVADFQNRSDIFVFLLSTRAGGLGINLTAADTVIFYDSDWNPTVDQQAMDRAHRLGQTKQVTVYRLVCKDTIEERILQRAREKSEIQHMVISGGNFKPDTLKPKEVVSLLLDDEELERKFRQRQNERQQFEDDGSREKKRKRKKMEKLLSKKKRAEENIVSRAPSVTSTPDGDSVFSVDSVPASPYSEHSLSSLAIPEEESSNDSQLVVDDASPSNSPTMPSLLTVADGSPFSLGYAMSPGSPSQSSRKTYKRGTLRGRGRPRGVARRGSRGRVTTMATAAAELAAAQAGKSAAYAAYGYTMPSSNQQSTKTSLPTKLSQRASYRSARSLRRTHGVNPLLYRTSGGRVISKKNVFKETSSNSLS